MTEVVKSAQLKSITEALKSGKTVAFATDTVFGLGVVYSNYLAVKKMKAAKGRDEKKPFPLMVADISQMHEVAFLTERDEKIAEKLTPGALTMILKKKSVIPDEFTNGFPTIAIRIPDDKFVLELLKEVGPMFVTSANISGKESANNTEEVLQQLDGRIDMVVEGQAKSHKASTIIDCTGEQIKVLRQGDISLEDINSAINC